MPFNFTRAGVRIPFVVVSPWGECSFWLQMRSYWVLSRSDTSCLLCVYRALHRFVNMRSINVCIAFLFVGVYVCYNSCSGEGYRGKRPIRRAQAAEHFAVRAVLHSRNGCVSFRSNYNATSIYNATQGSREDSLPFCTLILRIHAILCGTSAIQVTSVTLRPAIAREQCMRCSEQLGS